MPLPLLGLLAAAVVGAVGIASHANAKETNQKAQEILEDAEKIYNEAQIELEKIQKKTESSLLKLGYCKKHILETSVNKFLECYKKIKDIKVENSVGLEEIANFYIKNHEALKLKEMSDIYQKAFSKGTTGAAAGAVVALAVSGSLPVVTGTLSVAGSLVVAGNIGAAVGLAGSAFSFAATMTPLAAIAAPVVLFTGISSNIKAEENLEKARVSYAEAKAAVEKIKITQTIYQAITERSKMFDTTLIELNKMFSYCNSLLEGVIRKKYGFFKRKITQQDFNDDEIKLIAVTRSLAGAVKALIDSPILTPDGQISKESCLINDNTVKNIPEFSKAIEEIKKCGFKQVNSSNQKQNESKSVFFIPILVVLIGVFLYSFNKVKNNTNSTKTIDNISYTVPIQEVSLENESIILDTPIEEVNESSTLDNLKYDEIINSNIHTLIQQSLLENESVILDTPIEENLPENDILENFEPKEEVKSTTPLKKETGNIYKGPERNQFIFINGKNVFVDENGYIIK